MIIPEFIIEHIDPKDVTCDNYDFHTAHSLHEAQEAARYFIQQGFSIRVSEKVRTYTNPRAFLRRNDPRRAPVQPDLFA